MTAPAEVRTCYLHPDRVAGITCQRCDRPICPACMHQASVGFHCPQCAKSGGQRVYQGRAAFQSPMIVTHVLIAINVVVFAIGVVLAGSRALRGIPGSFGADGGLYPPIVPDEPWRLFTSGFMHAGLIHIGFNMWVLWVIGRMLEPVLGRLRYLSLYVASLLGGSLGVVALDAFSGASPNSIGLTVGASGAIFGLMGAALVVARDRNIDLMRSGLLPTVGINLLITFALPGISIGGHVGGLIGGTLAGWVLVELPKRVKENSDAISALVVVGLGIVFAGVAYSIAVAQWGNLS